MPAIIEDDVELQSIEWSKDRYQYKLGNEISPEGNDSERDDFREVILEERLDLLFKINPISLIKLLTILFRKYRILIFSIEL